MPEFGEYTIGWICALSKELIAAKAFLDALHDPVDNAAIKDDNNYTLGSIGKHNVVIAVLPYGQYGLVNAAAALAHMTRTFPNLRAVLMVGIGGGVPGTNDIRLGDIVVGTVGRMSSGVIQYDYGRAVQGQEFAATGHLNQPPMAFLTAMSALHATYEMEGHDIERNIDKALRKYKRLAKKYKRPAAHSDRLYEANFVHQGYEGVTCGRSCGDDNLVHRDEREEDENNPAVHYGLIASGNSLMKDALLRDKLAAKHGILCFEMEAAGLMNHFPCVVVRGICDYSDSHKNDEWQEYAAMVAAAYTKDLLLQVAPSSMLKEKRIETLLSQLNDKVEGIHQIATDNNRNIISLSSSIRDDAISRWLNPSDPSVDHNKARQGFHSGTGEWLLKSPQYRTWKSKDSSFLWLYGNSGTGKTILSSTVIEDLRKSSRRKLRNCAVLYFYITFTDNQKQSLDAILRSLINQLYHSQQQSSHPTTLLYTKCGNGSSQPSTEQLESTFRDMLSAARKVFVLIDALDEYENRSNHRDELLTWIERFRNRPVNTHLLVTSRPEHDIKASVESWADPDSIISLETDTVGKDISEYVRDVVANSTSFRRWYGHTSTQDDIVNALTAKAGGVFRWVALQLERLKDCINREEVNMILQTLPTSLQKTYYQLLNELTSTRRKYVIRILQFLAYSDIPLELEAAVDALAIDLTAPSGSRFIMKELSRTSGPILGTRYDMGLVLQLAHSLTGDTTAWKLNPAIHIAAEFGHLETVALLIHKGADVNAEGEDHNVLCTAIIAGHLDVVALLAQEGADLEAQQPWAGNALEVACRLGRLDIIELLIKHGAEVEPRSRVLSDACCGGNLNIVKLLVEEGADVNTGLESACINGQLDIVMFLLGKGADTDVRRGRYTVLQHASRVGRLHIVEYLLEKGADVNAQGSEETTALHIASSAGYLNIVKHLVENGADINAPPGTFGTALCVASREGNLNIARYLVQKGADINAPGGVFGNALQAAVIQKHYETAEFLRNHSASLRYVNMPNTDRHWERHRHQISNLVLDGRFNPDI
ncbi:pfs domain-containing protein [Fusarium napiforme]|uniref:Pfs domain-containing protein n=1 Tax=Fusarium napiforme TaxID=42672 RepID=A0A8H5IPP2_9HYPO|nr:pfs domain-containing protein [Fusarium napiforme]